MIAEMIARLEVGMSGLGQIRLLILSHICYSVLILNVS
jgi:hypothetical protein